MKLFKFLLLTFAVVSIFASCTKDDALEVVDQTPDFTPEVVVEKSESITIGSRSVECDGVALAVFFDDNGDFLNYSFSVEANQLNLSAPVFGLTFDRLTASETTLVEDTYPGEYASTISQAGVDKLDEWQSNGADPNNQPDLTNDITFYDASGLSIAISNINGSTADVQLSGSVTDQSSNTSIDISGTFTDVTIRQ